MNFLLCLYTCEQDRHFLDALWRTPMMQDLQMDPRFKIQEVYADERRTGTTLENDKLTVSCREAYTSLSVKTYLMIQSVLNLQFDFLLKLDVSIINYDKKRHLKSNQTLTRLTPQAVQLSLTDPMFFDRQYNGLVNQSANQKGFESWAGIKNIQIDYAKVFPEGGRTPDYFLGKFYSLSHEFCQFIADHGWSMALQHQRHLGGSEDVLIGRLYALWKSQNPKTSS